MRFNALYPTMVQQSGRRTINRKNAPELADRKRYAEKAALTDRPIPFA